MCSILIDKDQAYFARYGIEGLVLLIDLELYPVAHGFFLVLLLIVAHV